MNLKGNGEKNKWDWLLRWLGISFTDPRVGGQQENESPGCYAAQGFFFMAHLSKLGSP